jgi:DNA-binding MarR family transcriptional regulator
MSRLSESSTKIAAGGSVKTPTAPRPRGSKASREQWEAELLELGRAFRRVFRGVRRMRGRDTHLIGGEVSHAQMELLIELSERGALSAGELAHAAGLTPATVTQMLDHLAACGHVQRTRSDSDRRVVVTQLTPQGEEKVAAKREQWQARWQTILADVGAEELRVTTSVLDRLSAVFEDASEGGECAPEK